jgi:hypothetical protein
LIVCYAPAAPKQSAIIADHRARVADIGVGEI